MDLARAIEDYRQWMISKGYATCTICLYRGALRHFQRFIATNETPWDEIFTFSMLTRFQKAKNHSMGSNAVNGLARYLYKRRLIPAPIRKPHQPLPTHYEDFLVYFSNTRGVGTSYVMKARAVLSALNDYLDLRSINLPDIGIEDADDFSAQYKPYFSDSTRRRIRSHLRNFFRYLYYERRIIKRDIASLIVGATLFAQAKPPRFLRAHEIRQVFEGLSMDGGKALRTAAMVHLGFLLGLRPKEISLIRLDDISFSNGTIQLPDRKCNNPITLPLPEKTIKVIAAYVIGARPASEHRSLFLNLFAPYGPISAPTVGSEITTAIKRVNPKATAYWLRHTYAQNLFEAGTGIFEVKEMMGHDCIQSTRRYLHINLKLMRGLFDE